jgi:hypothetical protein
MNVSLNVLGIEPHGAMQGVSLLPLIINENSENINLISYSETVMPRIRFTEPELVSLRTENWKYIRYIEDGFEKCLGEFRVYINIFIIVW